MQKYCCALPRSVAVSHLITQRSVVQIHPPQPKLLRFLKPTNTPVRAVRLLIILIGGLSGVRRSVLRALCVHQRPLFSR